MTSATLVEVSDFVLDGTHSSPARAHTGVPVLSAQNVNGGTLSFDTARFTTQSEYEAFSRRLSIRPDDLLLTIVGSIGRAALVTEVRPLVFQRSVAVVRPKPATVDPKFLFYATQTADFQEQLRKATNASSQAGVYLGRLKETVIPVPSLSEQRRIADILGKADALREKRSEALGVLESVDRSLFLDLFGDPVSNPRGWPIGKLTDLGQVDRGVSKHRPRNAPELLGGPYPLVQTGEVASSHGYIRSHRASYSDLGLRQSKLWPAGTLCITIAANIAKAGILTFDSCFPDSVVGFTADDPATVEFVRVWLSFLQQTLESSAPESAQKNINLAILRDLDVVIPPPDARQQFAARVAQVERLRLTCEESMNAMNDLFRSLQHRAFTRHL